jgi:hypothetical protein
MANLRRLLSDSSADQTNECILERRKSTSQTSSVIITLMSIKVVGLFDFGQNPWHATAFRTVSATLAKMTEQPAA